VDDANAAFTNRFPRTKLVVDARTLFNYQPDHIVEVLEFVLAKEKT
jgi:hypothetical protein